MQRFRPGARPETAWTPGIRLADPARVDAPLVRSVPGGVWLGPSAARRLQQRAGQRPVRARGRALPGAAPRDEALHVRPRGERRRRAPGCGRRARGHGGRAGRQGPAASRRPGRGEPRLPGGRGAPGSRRPGGGADRAGAEARAGGDDPARQPGRLPARSQGRAAEWIASMTMAIQHELWGGETAKAVENFPVSGERVPAPVVHWLGRIKAAAARVNAELGLLDSELAERIARAGDEVASGEHDDQFPIDVFQTGSGTSSNMNANEVMASLAGDDVHANDHVNMGQSSNDVFPSAVHLAAVEEARERLLPALERLAGAFERKADEFSELVKAGRTHMMDAVPVTLGQEFAGYAAQMRLGRDRVQGALGRASQIPLGGTATGTGLNTHPEFAERVRAQLGLGEAPADHFEAQANRDGLVELHATYKSVAVSLTKIANDLVLMGSGPRTGLAELRLPELQKGSSIMPGKVNPVIPEVVLQVAAQVMGNDTAVTVAGSQGAFELNVRVPMLARNVFESLRILSAACTLLAEKCVDGIEADEETLRRHAESTPAIATALNPFIGYDKGTEIVQEAVATRRTIREVALEKGVDEETLDKALDLRQMARGSKPGE